MLKKVYFISLFSGCFGGELDKVGAFSFFFFFLSVSARYSESPAHARVKAQLCVQNFQCVFEGTWW